MTSLTTPVILASAALWMGAARPLRRLVPGEHAARLHPATIPAAVAVLVGISILADRASVILAGAIAGLTVLRGVEGTRRRRARARNREIVSTFLSHVSTNLRAGATLAAACERASAYVPPRCPPELAAGLSHLTLVARLGAEPTDTTAPELVDVAALWKVGIRRGLPMADLIARARDRVDGERRHAAATDAALTGPKTTATVLALLPLAGVAMGSAMGANPLGLLFGGGFGGALLVAGTALLCGGYLTCQYIIERAAA